MGIMGRDDISLCRSYGKSLLHITVSIPHSGIPELQELWELCEEMTYHCVALMDRLCYISLCRSALPKVGPMLEKKKPVFNWRGDSA